MKNLFWKLIFVFSCISLFFLGVIVGLFYYYSDELPPISELYNYELMTGSELYDKDDNLVYKFAYENRKISNLDDLPPYFLDVLLAVEDVKYFEHWGVDMMGLVRAFSFSLLNMKGPRGTSTITQQLARNMFLSFDKTIPRKIKEILLAIKLERNFSKQEILELYLNKVYFGSGSYGIKVAANKYFNKSVKELTKSEVAVIVGLLKGPGRYNPLNNPVLSIRRRNIVFERMRIMGILSESEYETERYKILKISKKKGENNSADYFVEHVRREILKQFSANELYAGGLKIYSTLDTKLQFFADSIMNSHLTKIEETNDYEVKYNDFPTDTVDITTNYIQAGVFSIEPATGYVRVLIGGRNFNHSKFNRIIQAKRQPGSAFKPITYSTALRYKYTPSTVIQDEPIEFISGDTMYWDPKNYSKQNFGYITMRQALTKSRNIYAIKLGYDLGIRKIIYMARRFGIASRLTNSLSLSIGSHELNPIELIMAYTTFPNNGSRTKPIFIRRVEDKNGKILFENKTEKFKVLDERTNFLIRDMMTSVIKEGTGRGALWRGFIYPAGGKTGTTNDFRDAWFVGYTKRLLTGIWTGFDNYETLGESQSGAVVALPIWAYIMKYATENDESLKNSYGKINIKKLSFDIPKNISKTRISSTTGLLPTSLNEPTTLEFFITGSEPTIFADSLPYNFHPTSYRVNNKKKLIVDLGGEPYDWNSPQEMEKIYPDSTNQDIFIYSKVKRPKGIDFRGAAIMKNHKYVERDPKLPLIVGDIYGQDDLIDEMINNLLIESTEIDSQDIQLPSFPFGL